MADEDSNSDREEFSQKEDTSEKDAGQQDSDRDDDQKKIDQIVQKRLKRQEEQFNKKIAEQYGDYDSIKAEAELYRKAQEANASDAERWERKVSAAEARAKDLEDRLSKQERASLVADLASDKGLPKKYWKRVEGADAESIEADIDSLIDDLGFKNQDGDAEDRPRKGSPVKYGGGSEKQNPDPDIEKLVAGIPRGPQIRVDKHR